MPNYMFKCEAGHEFNLLLKINERDEPQECPECEAKAARQISVPASAHFKGDWYKTTGKY